MKTRAENTEPGVCSCPICHDDAAFLDRLNFNKSCEEIRGFFLPPSEKWIDYFLCDQCGFCFAPEMHRWSFDEFGKHVYNQDYESVDPDYKLARPQANSQLIEQIFGANKNGLRHLDYGGGSGLLSSRLCEKGWDSTTYDPFVNADVRVADLGSYDLVTAFEVFEHVTDVDGLLRNLNALCKPDGAILFSTLLSDGQITRGQRVSWWYAGPRNGHISVFSANCLRMYMQKGGFQLASFSDNLHIAFRTLPVWAGHLVKTPEPQTQASALASKLKEGFELHVNGKLVQAQTIYEEILAQDPAHCDALHLMGVLAMQAGNCEGAVDFFGRAIAIRPDHFGFYINHGGALRKLARFGDALESFDKAIALNPNLADLHLMRGEVLHDLHQFDAAIASFDRALAMNPDLVDAQTAREKTRSARNQAQAS